MFGLPMRHSKFIWSQTTKITPASIKFAWNSVAHMSTEAASAASKIVVNVYAFEGNSNFPYIGAQGSMHSFKVSTDLVGVDVSKMFLPVIYSLRDAVQGSLMKGAYYSSNAGIYSPNSAEEISSLVDFKGITSILLPITSRQVTDIVVKAYLLQGIEAPYNGEPGSEHTYWVNSNLEETDLTKMWGSLVNGIGGAIKSCAIDGACFSSDASVYSPEEENALAALVGQEAFDAGIF